MDFFKGRLQASEGSYHKKEQEYAIREHREKLIKEGKMAASKDLPKLPISKTASPHYREGLVDVLPEILQQGARVGEPEVIEIARAKGLMPPITGSKKAPKLFWGSNALGNVPATSLGRSRWNVEMPKHSPPTEVENQATRARRLGAERALRASARALMYGAAVGIAGTFVGVRMLMYSFDVYSAEDLRHRVNQVAAPMACGFRDSISPYAKWAKDNWAIDVKADQDASAIGDLAKKISSKLNPAKGGKSPFQL
mmetsp:Transcript_3624/g.6773  ORF Transcript_3624/g.6773 Transcript_3624/m.6773 type:complete len:254 (+) Transcript_3624:138-899(+)